MTHAILITLLTIIGMGAGSFATTALYRLPRGELWLGERPNCNLCNHRLYLRDFIPIFSYFVRQGYCRYCGGAYQMELPYFLTELGITLLFVANYLRFGLTESYLLLTFFGMMVIIMAIADWLYHRIESKLLLTFFMGGLVYRTAQDHTIFPMIDSVLIVALVAAGVRYGYFALQGRKAQGEDFLIFSPTNRFIGPHFDRVKLAAGMALWVGTLPTCTIIAMTLLLAYCLHRFARIPRVPVGTIALLMAFAQSC